VNAAAGVTRRRLLQAGGTSLALAAVGGAGRVVTAGAAAPAADALRRSRYAPHVGRTFRLTAPDGTSIQAKLAAVEDLAPALQPRLRGSDDAFVLIFRGPARPRLEQDVLDIRNPAAGRAALLASPSSRGRHGQDYAVVVNRLPPSRLEHS
jgi:hypothetical protein